MKLAVVAEESSRVLLAAVVEKPASLAQLAERSLRRLKIFDSGRGTEIETLTRHSFFFLSFCLVGQRSEGGGKREEKEGATRE